MAEKRIEGTISADHQSVDLVGHGAPSGLTFRVTKDDRLHWTFARVPRGGQVEVAFRSFQEDDGAPAVPIAEPLVSPLSRSVAAGDAMVVELVSGAVRGRSLPGRYFYAVLLHRPGMPSVELRCLWNGAPVDMGGGEKSGKPTP